MRRHLLSRWIIMVALAGSVGVASAQPEMRDHRGEHRPPNAGPTEAPPPPREENMAPRAGFVWIAGRWDWHGKWEWMPGHWERERAGKHWRAGRWDNKDNRWAYAEGGWEAGPAEPPPTATPPPPAPAPPPADGPREAPPPPREEKNAPRAGFVWIPGQWDWRNHKWEWVPGRWERERTGKKWRATRWEQHDGAWARVDGTWEDIAVNEPPPNAPPPPPGASEPPPGELPPPPEEHQHRHREWKIDRPAVSSYWPAKGKVGTRVVIHGRNFPADAELMFADQPVHAAKVKPEEIVFEIPAGASSGTIAVRTGHGRPLIVGDFEVATGFDPIAEQKKIEEEQRKAAEAAWQARQKELAKDRAARQAALEQRRAEREANREQRRADELARVQAKWQRAFLADPDTQSELTLHAQRVAEIARMSEMADLTANGKLAVRIQVLQTKEDARHQQRMAALQTSFQSKGGQP